MCNFIGQLSDSEKRQLYEDIKSKYCIEDKKNIKEKIIEIIAIQAMVPVEKVKLSSKLKDDLNITEDTLKGIMIIINVQLNMDCIVSNDELIRVSDILDSAKEIF